MVDLIEVRIPAMGSVATGLAAFCCMLERISGEPKAQIRFDTGWMDNVQPRDFARNTIVREFLKGKASRLWFIDSDVVPHPNALFLPTVDADIACGIYPQFGHYGKDRKLGIQWTHYNWTDKADGGYIQPEIKVSGIHEVDAAATGMMVIKRKVLEDPRMVYPPEYDRFTGEKKMLTEGEPPAIFRDRNMPNGHFDATDDIDFCFRAKALGYTVKVDYSVLCGHRKTVDLKDFVDFAIECYAKGHEEALAEQSQATSAIEVAH